MVERIVAINIPIVDVVAHLPDATYEQAQQYLNRKPGEWAAIDEQQAEDLAAIITDRPDYTLEELFENPDRFERILVTAGSTALNMLNAMPEDVRNEATLITAIAEDNPLSQFFSDAVTQLGVRHQGVPIEGENSVLFAMNGDSDTEKLMAVHAGIGPQLENFTIPDDAGLVMIDAYELRSGTPLSKKLDTIIRSGQYPIVLTLGNQSLLEDVELRDRILSYIESGLVTIVCGNDSEYEKLYPDAPSRHLRDYPAITENVSHALKTHGPDGMSAYWNGELVDIAAVPLRPEQIVSTIGAGDTAAGEFIAGVWKDASPQETLERAAKHSAKVLQQSGGRILVS